MQIAASEGQTIYTINQQNYAEILPKLQLQGSTLTDINNAMWAGRVVTVHEKTLSYKSWTGDGYSIVDPNTGGGAYLINGGANGAIAYFYGVWLASITALLFLGFVASIAGGPLAIGAMAILTLVIIPYVLAILARVTKALNPTNDPKMAEFIRGCIVVGFVDANFANVFFGKFVHGRLLGLLGYGIGKSLKPGDTLECLGIR